MATIKQRIDSVTEDVSTGKDNIAHAITVKGVDTVSGDTFATMAANILKLMVIQLDMPSINYSNKTVTLSSKMSGATIYYRFNLDTSWITYTNPLTNITGGTIETYCKKEGYVSSEIATQTLDGIGVITVVGDGIIVSVLDGDFDNLEVNNDFDTLYNPHIAYGNGLYVIVGNYGETIYSPDGVNWESHASIEDFHWNDITYCNGYFVAVSSAGAIARCTDGVDWEIIHEGKGCLSKIITVHEGNAMFILSDKKTYETTDGTDLVETSTYPFQNYNLTDMITYGAYSKESNTPFVSFLGGDTGGLCSTTSDYTYWTSPTNINYGLTENWNNICSGAGKYMIVGAFGHVLVSNDGRNWEVKNNIIEVSGGLNYCGLTYGNGKFIHASGDSISISENDGENWVRYDTGVGGMFSDVIVV